MGKAARAAQRERRRENVAEFGVFCVGMLEVLSIGKGDLKIKIETAADVEKAKETIDEMLRKGYSIYVDTDDGPVRVKAFDPDKMEYTIVDTGSVTKAPAKRAKRAPMRRVPVAGSRATAVGRTSGG